MRRVAVFGASGFVGTAVVERLLAAGASVRAVIHSSGNAWDLARRFDFLVQADLMQPETLRGALDGCTHVVNCSRGGDEVMVQGLRNLLEACVAARVVRLVHLSSVAVYGDPPRPEASSEDAPPHPTDGYGRVKAQQDELVAAYARKGLASVILCPPSITGAGSDFVVDVLQALRAGRLALVDGGATPINVVDVNNLARAAELALDCAAPQPRRHFVVDDAPQDWRTLVAALLPLGEVAAPPRTIDRDEAARALPAPAPPPRASPLRSLKHLVSSDVRAALRKDPLLAGVDRSLRRVAGLLPTRLEDALRRRIEGPLRVARVRHGAPLDPYFTRLQLRGVRHECRLARSALGYEPLHSFERSVAAFRAWYETLHGFGGEFWPLARELEG